MTATPNTICHEGIVDHIENNKAFVQIQAHSACDSCHTKGVCSLTEIRAKFIEAEYATGQSFNPGDRVEVIMERSTGNKAVLMGYFFPFVLLILTLIIGSQFLSEGLAGLLTVLVVGVYYLALWLLRGRIEPSFTFRIRSVHS